MSTFSICMLDEHDAVLKAALFERVGVEGAAYLLFKEAVVASDPWDRRRHTKLLVREIIPITPTSADGVHITWDTKSYVSLLQRSADEGLVLGIAHSHPGGPGWFSSQDDKNEIELLRTACNRNGSATKLVSVLLAGAGDVRARVWQHPAHQAEVRNLLVIGDRIQIHDHRDRAASSVFARQTLAFGPELPKKLKGLRAGVIGAGGTGSAAAPLLARLGVGNVVIVDDDIVDVTNLNRLHGGSQSDADSLRPKAELAAAEIARMGIGCRALALRGWVNALQVRDALKACDVIFCCTDDHAGRIFLNRLAYYYLIPVFDIGLAMAPAKASNTGMADISARVTTLIPPEPCLLCRGAVDLEIAREEDLRRQTPEEYERRKREAYIRGAGNPNPAVVTFTTEAACMGVNEFLNRVVGYRKKHMGSEVRRRFLFCEDRSTSAVIKPMCPVCGSREIWGLGDVNPFLDMVG
jgi:molybdopterin/thiamine biosynthesis adenylyltransferase